MYICMCNALTDSEIQEVVQAGCADADSVYGACGCEMVCGRCRPTIDDMVARHGAAAMPAE